MEELLFCGVIWTVLFLRIMDQDDHKYIYILLMRGVFDIGASKYASSVPPNSAFWCMNSGDAAGKFGGRGLMDSA
jgi:hypothetical protein